MPGVWILLAAGVAVYFLFSRSVEPAKPKIDKGLGTETGDDISSALSDIASQLKASLAGIATPDRLPNIVACIPKYTTQSHRDGRAPWIGENCNKRYAVRGVRVESGAGPILFTFTRQKGCFNFNAVRAKDPDIWLFVTSPDIGLGAAWNAKTKKLVPFGDVVIIDAWDPSLEPNWRDAVEAASQSTDGIRPNLRRLTWVI